MRPLALTAVLFTGPIATEALNWWDGEPLPHRQPLLTRLGLRNLVVAPATEEFTFRACMAPLLLLHVSPMTRRLRCECWARMTPLSLLQLVGSCACCLTSTALLPATATHGLGPGLRLGHAWQSTHLLVPSSAETLHNLCMHLALPGHQVGCTRT